MNVQKSSDIGDITKEQSNSLDMSSSDIGDITKEQSNSLDMSSSDIDDITKEQSNSLDMSSSDIGDITKEQSNSLDMSSSDIDDITKQQSNSLDMSSDDDDITDQQSNSLDMSSDDDDITDQQSNSLDMSSSDDDITDQQSNSLDMSSSDDDITDQQSNSLDMSLSFETNKINETDKKYSTYKENDIWIEHCVITATILRTPSNDHMFKKVRLPAYAKHYKVCIKCRMPSKYKICKKCQHKFKLLSTPEIECPNKKYITTIKYVIKKTTDVASSSSIDTINKKDYKEPKKLEEKKEDDNIDECESKNLHSEQHEVTRMNQENEEIIESLSDNGSVSIRDNDGIVPSASEFNSIHPIILLENPGFRCSKLY